MKKSFVNIVGLTCIFLAGCSALRESPKYQLGDDTYLYRTSGGKYHKARVYVTDDSVAVILNTDNRSIDRWNSGKEFFLKRSFDVDVVTIAFKYRPATINLPRQLTTDFNGNIFLGYRFDRFKITHKETPFGRRPQYGHRGITGGVIGGIGSTSVTPWTTNNQITDEYNGFTLSRGFALMLGVNNLTVGMGIGWDSLTDRDKSIWIYQNKPWYGLSVGLNLN
jgi:hypothetical protein